MVVRPPAPTLRVAALLAVTVALAVPLAATPAGAPSAAAAREQEDRTVADSHRRMIETLAAVGEDSPQAFRLVEKLHRMREIVDQMPPEAPLRRRVSAMGILAELELREGNIARTLELIDRQLSAVSPLPERQRLGLELGAWFYQGVAHLLRGENQNCLELHTGEMCILPIRAGGVHVRKEPSRAAAERFGKVVRRTPPDGPLHIAAKWLANIAHMTLGDYPGGVPEDVGIDPAVFTSEEEFPRFREIAPNLHLDTFNFAGGSVIDDFDGDGYLDIVTSTMDPSGQIRFYRSEGDGTFTDGTEEANLTGIVAGLNLESADYDNDGDVDVLVLRGAWLGESGRRPNSLLRNDGGTFTDVTFDSGLAEENYPTQVAAWADYDGDGDLDLYVGNEALQELDYPSQLFRNEGDGTFVDVAAEAGVENRRWTKGAAWGDYDGDGDPDLYVSNYHDDNRLYRNDGDGTFTDVAAELGVTGPSSSFATWFWDVNNDGHLDLLANSYLLPDPGRAPAVWYAAASQMGLEGPGEPPSLYLGDGEGGFVEVAEEWGIAEITLPMGANFGDIDTDGFPDFYLGTGYPGYEGLVPNVMYRNVDGRRFADVTYAGGFGHIQKGHGISFADIDNDGDQDVYEQMGGFLPADRFFNALYENPGFGHHWITIELRGRTSNRLGVGARIRVDVVDGGERRSIYHTVGNGGSFGANPHRAEIGLRDAERIATLEVGWPTSGTVQTFHDLEVDRFVRITEGDDRIEFLERPSFEFVLKEPRPHPGAGSIIDPEER